MSDANRTIPCWRVGALVAALLMVLSACGGGGDSVSALPGPAPLALKRVSADSLFAPGCDSTSSQRPYQNAEVEPHLAVNPANPSHLVGAWQQDRWHNGGAHGLASVFSLDGGQTWSNPAALPFTRCAGHDEFPRATDPWIAISPNGVVHALGLAFAGNTFQAGSRSAMLVSRSTDAGASWSAPVSVHEDGSDSFNDKGAITADPVDANHVYVVWDRLEPSGTGPTLFARTRNGGLNWDPAVVAYDPGASGQTIGNQVVVLPDGSLALLFTELVADGNLFTAQLALRRSSDHGDTWSAKVKVADMFPVGASDPETGRLVRDGSLLFDVAMGDDGQLAAVWQDARFSGGQRDAIALTRSADGGQTWSVPVQVNAAPQVQAFTPSVSISAEGLIGVDYFDFRHNTTDAATLPTTGWLALSGDGQSWREGRSSGPFNLNLAPDADGYFVGDYKSLRALGSDFVLFMAHTNADTANRTDVYSSRVAASAIGATAKVVTVAAAAHMTPELKEKVSVNIRRQLQERPPPRKAAQRLGKR